MPSPRRGLDKEREDENRCGGKKEGDILRKVFAPMPTGFPRIPAAQANQRKNQGNPNPEVHQPELKKRRGEIVVDLYPARMPLEDRSGVELLDDQPNKKSCRNNRA